MPKLDQEQLKNIRYLSLVDFNNKIDQYENPSDKVKFATQYLLTYGLATDPDYKLAESIHFVRVKLSESVNDKNMDLSTKVFMADPVKYLKSHAIAEAAKYENNNNINDDQMISEHYHQLEEELNGVLAHQIRDLDNNKTAFDIKTRMANKLGSKNAVDKLYKDTKPRLFSRIFNTSSLQAKNLDKAFKEFNDPTVNAYGNMNMLDEAARAYLTYKLGWKDGDPLPYLNRLDSLDKTSKARCLLSIKAIEAAREQRKIEDKFAGMDQESVKDVKPEEILGLVEETKEKTIMNELEEDSKIDIDVINENIKEQVKDANYNNSIDSTENIIQEDENQNEV